MEGKTFLAMIVILDIGFSFTIELSNGDENFYSCRNGVDIERQKICDGVNDCGNWDDECECEGATTTLCKFQSCVVVNESIRRRQMCDGYFDCSDLSDECLCDKKTQENSKTYDICKKLFSKSTSDSSPYGCLPCTHSGQASCIMGYRICDGKTDCDDEVDEIYCDNTMFNIITTNRSCINGQNESTLVNCTQFHYCPGQKEAGGSGLTPYSGDQGGYFIDWRRTFDGVADCDDFSDEWHSHFVYCSEILDSSDRTESRCRGDGTRLIESPEFVYRSRIYAGVEWIIAVVIVLANGTLVATTTRSLIRSKSTPTSAIRTSNQVMILSLSLSDLFLGLQMVGNVISDSFMAGDYWRYDVDWKSSKFCTAIGSLSVTLTQVSVFTITAISALRLNTVLRPFSVLRVRYVVLIALSVWTFAIIPVILTQITSISSIERYSTSAVSLPTLPQVDQTVLERGNLEKVLTKVSILRDLHQRQMVQEYNFEHMRWIDLEQIMAGINPKFGGWRYFGLYSHTSTCYPPIIMTTQDNGWRISIPYLILEFVSYIFVFAAYVTVYCKTSFKIQDKNTGCDTSSVHLGSKRNDSKLWESRRVQEDADMQRRIFLLVATDMICWFPACILSFISVLFPDSGVNKTSSLSMCIVLIQLNSMINPFLYSKSIRRNAFLIVKCLPNAILRKTCCFRGKQAEICNNTVNFTSADIQK